MNKEQTIRYNQCLETALDVRAELIPRYKAEICRFDRTAIAVKDITDVQHMELCKKLRCSGHYSEKAKTGFLTNFGVYR